MFPIAGVGAEDEDLFSNTQDWTLLPHNSGGQMLVDQGDARVFYVPSTQTIELTIPVAGEEDDTHKSWWFEETPCPGGGCYRIRSLYLNQYLYNNLDGSFGLESPASAFSNAGSVWRTDML